MHQLRSEEWRGYIRCDISAGDTKISSLILVHPNKASELVAIAYGVYKYSTAGCSTISHACCRWVHLFSRSAGSAYVDAYSWACTPLLPRTKRISATCRVRPVTSRVKTKGKRQAVASRTEDTDWCTVHVRAAKRSDRAEDKPRPTRGHKTNFSKADHDLLFGFQSLQISANSFSEA